MNLKMHNLRSKTRVRIENEVLFEVASARSLGIELLRLDISDAEGERFRGYVEKNLRSLKRNGRIQLFILASALSGDSTEAEYLKNKYPSIVDEVGEGEFSFVIKI